MVKMCYINSRIYEDVYVDNTIEDYKNGYDRQLEEAYKIIKESKKQYK